MMHRARSSIVEVPYCFSRSSVKFQGHTALKIVEFDPKWAFPDCNSSLNSPMAMKCCTKLETAKERCPIVFQGHPSNFKVTRYKASPILTQIGHFRTIGQSQLSNPSDLPCSILSKHSIVAYSMKSESHLISSSGSENMYSAPGQYALGTAWEFRLKHSESLIISHYNVNSIRQVWWNMATDGIIACDHTVCCCFNVISFLQNFHNRHPRAHPWRQAMECHLWVQTLIYDLPQLLQRCLQYQVILDHIITAPYCPWDCRVAQFLPIGMIWYFVISVYHYSDVIMSTVTSQITSISIVCWTICKGADQRKHQSSASLAFVRGIHRWPVNSPNEGPVTRKVFPSDVVIMYCQDRNSHGYRIMIMSMMAFLIGSIISDHTGVYMGIEFMTTIELLVTLQWHHNDHNGVSKHQPHGCCLLRCRSKKTSKLRVTGLCAGNSPLTSEFPAQRASNAEYVSIWWGHHVNQINGICVIW